jgi:hypothetical protein
LELLGSKSSSPNKQQQIEKRLCKALRQNELLTRKLVETCFPSRTPLPAMQRTEISPTLQTIYEKIAIPYNIWADSQNRSAGYPRAHFPLLPSGSMAGQGRVRVSPPRPPPPPFPGAFVTSYCRRRPRPLPPLVSNRVVACELPRRRAALISIGRRRLEVLDAAPSSVRFPAT